MQFKVLKRSHVKRNILIGVVVVAVISAVVLNFTRARYRVTESIPLVNGTINYKLYDFKIVSMYQENENGEYTEIEEMPASGYVINENESYCTLDNINKDADAILYTNDDGEHVIGNLKKNSKCYLYFVEYKISAKDVILANRTISTRSDFSSVLTTDTTGTIYQAIDDDGTTYYYAGAPTDNWVQWAGFYWRIIRINGDGTIRLIYNGTSTTTTGTETQLSSTSAFNSSSGNNAYVGFKYTIGSVHGTETNSTILTALNTWYSSNLSRYASYIDKNAGFCGDRTPSTDSSSINNSGGTGTIETYYGAYFRVAKNNNPSYKCPNSEDLYTTSNSSKGNKSLTYPIGLITADEVVFAGGLYGGSFNNTSYYLYNGNSYWTISPPYFSGSIPCVFILHSSGQVAWWSVTSIAGVRPVINLRADVSLTGSGTATDPYIVN